MQPYFFPYLGYFDLICSSTRWIFFDTVQYIRHGWINRNRILHPEEGWQYIIVPLMKHKRESLIRDVRLVDASAWRQRIKGQLQHYRGKAPFFYSVEKLIDECLAIEESSIARLDAQIIDLVCRHIGIRFEYSFFSEMDLNLGPVTRPGDWALLISEALGAREYVNLPGGAHLFDLAQFDERGITLTIRNCPVFEYPCNGYIFEPNLSIIDVLMWNSPEAIGGFLEGQRESMPLL